jgi:hypothetical protein
VSHITRRKFLAGSAALAGTVALSSIAPVLPTEAPIAAVFEAADPYGAYEAF